MSGDTHTGEVRRGRLATVDGDYASDHTAPEHASGPQPASARPDGHTGETFDSEPMLTWAADSSLMPVVGTQPRLRQMLGVCVWAAVLGVVGLIVGLRGFIAALMHETPSWYEPMMGGIGGLGIALTVAAFVSVHRRRTPFILLGAATAVLGYAIFLTAQAI